MDGKKTNVAYALAKYPHLHDEEKALVEKISCLDPEIADYWGHDPIRFDQILRAYFKLGAKMDSKEELERILISEEILPKESSIRVEETIHTEHGKMYFLSSTKSKFALYFINPEQ